MYLYNFFYPNNEAKIVFSIWFTLASVSKLLYATISTINWIRTSSHLWLKIQKTNNIFLNLIFYFSCSKSYSSTENEIQRSTTTKFMSWRPKTFKTNVLTLWFSHISYVKCCRKLPKFQCGRKLLFMTTTNFKFPRI